MSRTEALINLYIDANLILVLALFAWLIVRAILRTTAFRYDHLAQLRLAEGMMVAAVFSPLIAIALLSAHQVLYPKGSLNAADFAVAQFLDGRIQMKAEQFEAILTSRTSVVEHVATFGSAWAVAIVGLFILGFVTCTARIVRSVLRLKHLIGRSYLWRSFGRVQLRLSDEITVPFSTRDLRRHYVVLPSGMLTQPDALRIAVAHELQHMRRFDLEWEILVILLRPVFFWNPAYQIWRRKLEQLRELACDQILLERQRVTPVGYADCLVSVCRQSLAGPQGNNIVTPVVPLLQLPSVLRRKSSSLRTLRERVEAITAGTTRHCPRVASHGLLVAMVLAIGLGASAIQPPADWSQDRLMLSTVVNLERLETRNSGLSLAGF